MISADGVRNDLKELKDKGEKVTLADVIHALRLVVLLVLDVKQNQVTTMKHKGIALTTQREQESKGTIKPE